MAVGSSDVGLFGSYYVAARWLNAAQVADRKTDPTWRAGRSSQLSGEAVSSIVRDRMAAAGFDPQGYSGHSLRAGFATSATRAGVSTFKIRQQDGHASDAMLSRYVRVGALFLGNAAGILAGAMGFEARTNERSILSLLTGNCFK